MPVPGSGGSGGASALASANATLFGHLSLEERFGHVSGRALQDQIFAYYQASWLQQLINYQ